MAWDAARVRKVTALLVGRLGDLIVSTPFLRGLRERFPRAHIRLVVSAAAQEAARLIPFVDEVLPLHPYYRPGPNLRALAALRTGLQDLLVDLNPSFSKASAALAFLARAKVSAAFAKGRLDSLYALRAAPPGLREHVLDRYARLAALIGAPYEPRLEMRPTKEDERQADILINGLDAERSALRVAIHPGNFKKFDNRWPEEKFAELANLLLDEAGLSLYFLAGPGEGETVRGITARLRRPVPVLGPVPVGLTAALLKRLDIFVCNITGTTHLAAAVGAPTFGLYAGYTHAVWRPRGEEHGGVISDSWDSCRGIPVADAFRGLQACMQKRRGGAP